MDFLDDWLSNKCSVNDINKYFFGIRNKKNMVDIKLMEKIFGFIVYKNGCIIPEKLLKSCSNRLGVPIEYIRNRLLCEIALFYINYKNEYRIAVSLFHKTINNDSAKGYFNLALIYCNNNNFEKGIELCEIAANYPSKIQLTNGEAILNHRVLEAQYHVGHLYYKIQKNKEKCLYYYKMSADNNNPRAAYLVGCMAIKGVGCEKNEELSKYYIVKACQIIKAKQIINI
ncbi:hypothetical protein DICPUDRAFT_89216 [Dictyostelium purpureum]|uniref:Uncharacterized protein n=1 Tax=Dictyostelium purpureum TaxID=5786 RepID=F0ZUE4_DICPU|nr:uncharacterized protein DICPUDRAFT_89216 [Dictyostelium purpureum]EGC32433.1 hypothetical protein DICPUDRAFT_89216 [Dictyostelium purpureum]|eukprot:XP_003291045.1 hypothetical protein DICPUDRAFT_89216 [Dictyostelium purpureum]